MSEVSAETLEKFCSVTGSSQVDIARQLLQVCNGNLDMAIGMYMENMDSTKPGYSGGPSPEETPKEDDEEELRPPIPSKTEVLLPGSPPYASTKRFRRNDRSSVFDGFRDFQAESLASSTNSNGQKRQTLEELFRPPLDLIHKGPFFTAREEGKKQNKWLLVNIQDVTEFSCQILNRDVWSCPKVKRIIQKNFIFWQVYHDSQEGLKYRQFYHFNEWPYIAVIDPITGERIVAWNKLDAKSFCELVEELFVMRGSKPSEEKKGDNNLSESISIIDMSEEEQIKEALQASLQETNKVNKIEYLSTSEDDDDNNNDDDDDEDITNNENDDDCIDVTPCKQKATKRYHSSDEETKNNEPSKKLQKQAELYTDYFGDESDEKSNIVLRLPSGERKSLQLPCTSKLKALVLFVKESGFSPESHQLVANFPKRTFTDVEKTLLELGMHPHYTIFVQSNSGGG
ncbi:DgyrCDS2348 [Dimorphilus gyrociliatus]|uniref:DgyrCDS2348 n=1 Tax=Dimorphilus gyrociliatus TaxID=2664684 RepID=A0A7I8VBU0_9ANNE|nr:DgyrCDS2348 [Dimorphilus gyrociliatus]